MGKKILIVLGVLLLLVVGFAGFVAMQPADYHVERSITIDAKPETVFAQINNFKKWENWSPWAKLDPDAKESYEGPEEGKGAIFKWDGNDEVGEGHMEILESDANKLVKIKLVFVRPMPGEAITSFKLKEDDGKTVLTWDMEGENDFMGKAMCLFMDLDAMIGNEYEKGLAKLKSLSEEEKKEPTE